MRRGSYILFASVLLCGSPAVRAETKPVYLYQDGAGSLLLSAKPTVQRPHAQLATARSNWSGTWKSARWTTRQWHPVKPAAIAGKRRQMYDDIIAVAARRYGVDAELIKAVIRTESDFRARARSRKGASGLMQLMPATARQQGVTHIFDPVENIDGGVSYLRYLLNLYNGDERLALAAYNAGEGTVARYKGIPPYRETQNYVRKVLRFRKAYVAQKHATRTATR